MTLTGIYRVFHTTTAKYTFSSGAHITYPKMDHILTKKASLNKYKKIEITPYSLFGHNKIKVELNNKKIAKTTSFTFWLTMSSIFPMNFSAIFSKFSSLRVFMWVFKTPKMKNMRRHRSK
jgi:hypothetical protein